MKHFSIVIFLILIPVVLFAQNERKVIRQGVKAYHEGNFSDAEVQFRKAGDINQESFEAEFNTGAALYGQEKFEETVKQYETLVDNKSDPENLARVWHNMGNSMLEAQQYEPSIEAYKNSLRLNPSDQDTKYNLAYALKKLKEQQQQQENQDQQNQDNENQDKENQDKEQQDQEQKDQEQQDQEQKEQEQQDQEQKEQEQKEQEEEQQRPQEISKEDAERMLNAIQQQEKDVKEKVDKKKAAAVKVKTEKDW